VRAFRIADRKPDVHFLDPGNSDDVAGKSLINRRALEALVGEHLANLRRALVLCAEEEAHELSGPHRAPANAADANPSDVGVVGKG
jgi:hypothetical protein